MVTEEKVRRVTWEYIIIIIKGICDVVAYTKRLSGACVCAREFTKPSHTRAMQYRILIVT